MPLDGLSLQKNPIMLTGLIKTALLVGLLSGCTTVPKASNTCDEVIVDRIKGSLSACLEHKNRKVTDTYIGKVTYKVKY